MDGPLPAVPVPGTVAEVIRLVTSGLWGRSDHQKIHFPIEGEVTEVLIPENRRSTADFPWLRLSGLFPVEHRFREAPLDLLDCEGLAAKLRCDPRAESCPRLALIPLAVVGLGTTREATEDLRNSDPSRRWSVRASRSQGGPQAD